ncbi:MAG: fumarate hydratase C-terminal domain-containing protein [Nitrospirae bacterium]|nr:fumarate hydratase C-terminal domain-containing protein [Nitrospirota bacterium]
MQHNVSLNVPLGPESVATLRPGDNIAVSGVLLTGGLRLHEYLYTVKPELPDSAGGGVLFQCEPLIELRPEGGMELLSASPANSVYFERYILSIVKHYGFAAVMGKGGMTEATLKALRDNNCIYLHTISGAGVYLANKVNTISPVKFGCPPAILPATYPPHELNSDHDEDREDHIFSWYFTVEDFPAIVTSALTGKDLHSVIRELSIRQAGVL